MAYEKKTVQEYITETDDKTVEGFNDNQEDRISSGFSTLVSSGSNSNGTWVKFPDGTMICTATRPTYSWIGTKTGSLYKGSNESWTYAMPFTSSPVVMFTSLRDEVLGASIVSISATVVSFLPYASRTYNDASTRFQISAIGRWK